jgi:hypothetical protein
MTDELTGLQDAPVTEIQEQIEKRIARRDDLAGQLRQLNEEIARSEQLIAIAVARGDETEVKKLRGAMTDRRARRDEVRGAIEFLGGEIQAIQALLKPARIREQHAFYEQAETLYKTNIDYAHERLAQWFEKEGREVHQAIIEAIRAGNRANSAVRSLTDNRPITHRAFYEAGHPHAGITPVLDAVERYCKGQVLELAAPPRDPRKSNPSPKWYSELPYADRLQNAGLVNQDEDHAARVARVETAR